LFEEHFEVVHKDIKEYIMEILFDLFILRNNKEMGEEVCLIDYRDQRCQVAGGHSAKIGSLIW
jgi:hypothetical protein